MNITNLPICTLITDESLQIVEANRLFCEEFHTSNKELAGCLFQDLFAKTDRKRSHIFHRKFSEVDAGYLDFDIKIQIGSAKSILCSVKMSKDKKRWIICLDSLERAQENRKLKDATARLNAIFTYLHEGIVIIDHENKIKDCNHIAYEILHYIYDGEIFPTIAAIHDKNIQSFLPKDTFLDIHKHLEQNNIQPSFQYKQRYFIRGSWINFKLKPVFVDQSLFIGFIIGLSDVSKEIEDKEKIQSLLRVVCHDLSNPLAVVSSAHEYIKEHCEFKNLKETKMMIRMSSGLKVISSILDEVKELTAQQTGKTKIRLEWVPFSLIQDNLILLFKDRLDKKGILIEFKKNIESDFEIHGNGTMLTNNIFANLISNGIKFCQEGGKITIDSYIAKDKGTITVSDNGIGMPAQILSKLFDPDKHTSRAGTQGESGTGFGMPIVKSSVELCGGSIEVRSKEGENHGTTFTLHLDLRPTTPEQAHKPQKLVNN